MPFLRARQIAKLVQNKLAMTIPLFKARRANLRVVKEVQKSYVEEFRSLRKYADELLRTNEGTTIKIKGQTNTQKTHNRKKKSFVTICAPSEVSTTAPSQHVVGPPSEGVVATPSQFAANAPSQFTISGAAIEFAVGASQGVVRLSVSITTTTKKIKVKASRGT
ncbi:Uncharacterized protein TCM_024464 [Theobroma cacao]|uniref:Uncharacterized protein n=1 Tax=Theobroma cacao TaxID=3641 RepID=A0A061EW97_THECC|nr:Uncharacterized protein TCM_024464 [Theobroma cacao]